jgi:hypothetical protein
VLSSCVLAWTGAEFFSHVAQPVFAHHGRRLPTLLHVDHGIGIAVDGPLLQRAHIGLQFETLPGLT